MKPQPVPSTIVPSPNVGLYQSLLGRAWGNLALQIQKAHCHTTEKTHTGEFHIEAPTNWLGRLLARRLGLPQCTTTAIATLVIQPTAKGETWRRHFDNHFVVTFQSGDPHGHLLEQFASLEFRFRLAVENGGLIYDQIGVALWRGRVPLPSFISPRVVATEMPDGPNRVRVNVRVTMPLIGLLIAYDGRLNLSPADEP